MDDAEATVVTLTVGDDTNTTHIATTGNHADGAGIELDEVGDLASGEVNLDGVVDLDGRVGVADAVFTMISGDIPGGRTFNRVPFFFRHHESVPASFSVRQS